MKSFKTYADKNYGHQQQNSNMEQNKIGFPTLEHNIS